MCRKSNKTKLANQDRDLVEENANSIETLIVLARDNAKVDNEKKEELLKSLQNKLRYLISSPEQKVLKIDEEIKKQIQDEKIKLNKALIVELSDIKDFVKEVEVSIAIRNKLI